MTKSIVYFAGIVALGTASAWLGQKWRYEGIEAESAMTRDGGIRFQELKSQGDFEGAANFSEKETEAQITASQIIEIARAQARESELEGQAKRTNLEKTGELTTRDYYLEQMFGLQPAIDALKAKLYGDISPRERENMLVALDILDHAKAATRYELSFVRTQQASLAGTTYVQARKNAGCRF